MLFENGLRRDRNGFGRDHGDKLGCGDKAQVPSGIEGPTQAQPIGAVMKYWTMRNGKKILIEEMTDSHLENTIALIERKAPRYAQEMALSALAYASSAPDGAAMCAEQEAEALFDGDWDVESLFPTIRHLRAELRKRKRKARS